LTDLAPLLVWIDGAGVVALGRSARGVFVAAIGVAIVSRRSALS